MVALMKIAIFDSTSAGRDFLLHLQIYNEISLSNQGIKDWKDQFSVRLRKGINQISVKIISILLLQTIRNSVLL